MLFFLFYRMILSEKSATFRDHASAGKAAADTGASLCYSDDVIVLGSIFRKAGRRDYQNATGMKMCQSDKARTRLASSVIATRSGAGHKRDSGVSGQGDGMHDMASWFDTGGATHVGKVRTHNEDSYLIQARLGIWAVADGMGGHDAGDVASRTIIENLGMVPAPVSAAALLASCEERLVVANSTLKRLAAERGVAVIGSTVAVLLAYGRHYACVWAGDSRIYRVRAGAIEQVTIDHTEVQQLIDKGMLTPEEARDWPRRNVITRAIGVVEDAELELAHGTLMPGDIFILCSDGLTAHVDDHEILANVTEAPPQRACDCMVALTLARGAIDNVTVVVVRYDLDAPLDGAPAGEDVWE
jgi:serine/threonine protein phosphatase PrpC